MLLVQNVNAIARTHYKGLLQGYINTYMAGNFSLPDVLQIRDTQRWLRKWEKVCAGLCCQLLLVRCAQRVLARPRVDILDRGAESAGHH